MKNNDKKVRLSIFKKNYEVLKYIFKFCPHLIYHAILYIVCSVIKSLSKVLLITSAIDAVIKVSDDSNIYKLLSSILVYVLIIIICSIVEVWYDNYINPKYQLIFKKNIQHFLYSKVKNIDMELFDNPHFFDRFNRAMTFSNQRGFRVFNTIIDFIKSVSTIIALGTFIVIKDPILIIAIIICSILNYIILTINNKIWYKLYRNNQNDLRYKWYVNRTFYNKDNAAEIKTTNIDNILIDEFNNKCDSVETNYKKTYKKIYLNSSLYYFIDQLLKNALTYFILIYRLFKKLIDVSNFTAMVNATMQFSYNIGFSVTMFSTLKENALYIDDFLWILDYTPQVEKEKEFKNIKFDSLELKDLVFRYKETEANQIDNINLHINKGDKIAIVGENGGGKTTLTKLLLSFYNPTSGEILVNGINYNNISSKEIRDMYSIVFQDFKIYATTILENILMRKKQSDKDYEIALDALEKVGLKEKVLSLEKGLDTLVTREFDRNGVTLSGGERQRLVIARVFASNRDIYILDEPTSSLDPIAEEKINKLIINSSREKTMIIIAHRLSTVVDADKIYLIGDGKILEQGTHLELMSKNTRYKKMFNTQKHLYEKNKEENDA